MPETMTAIPVQKQCGICRAMVRQIGGVVPTLVLTDVLAGQIHIIICCGGILLGIFRKRDLR
jgi:hypothetical protein